MSLRYVRMREPGEAPGLTAKRHGVRHWNFQAGVWEIMKLSESDERFLRKYRNPADARLFDVANNESEAVEIIVERQRKAAEALSRQFSVAFTGNAPGMAGTDDDILKIATAKAAKRAVESAPRAATINEVEAAARAEVADAVAPEPPAPDVPDDDAANQANVVGLLASFVSHESAKAAAKKFGDKLSWIMSNDADKLLEINGIGKKTVDKIKKSVGNAR